MHKLSERNKLDIARQENMKLRTTMLVLRSSKINCANPGHVVVSAF